jgi:hypothetical protein
VQDLNLIFPPEILEVAKKESKQVNSYVIAVNSFVGAGAGVLEVIPIVTSLRSTKNIQITSMHFGGYFSDAGVQKIIKDFVIQIGNGGLSNSPIFRGSEFISASIISGSLNQLSKFYPGTKESPLINCEQDRLLIDYNTLGTINVFLFDTFTAAINNMNATFTINYILL